MFECRGPLCRPRIKALRLAFGAVLASLVLLCAQVVLLRAGLVGAQGTLDVCSGCTYESVQEAIDAADPGDTIRVAQGVYTENLVITKSLTLLGGFESSGWTRDIGLYETTIDGNRSGSVISVTNGCSTTIDGFTITHGATDRGGGIHVEGSVVTVANNQITENVTWFTRVAITITEPLRAGDTAVNGVCDPDLVDLLYAWDVTTDSYLGSDYAEPDGTFTVSLWSPLVQGHIIAAFGAYGWDEATVQAALGSSRRGDATRQAAEGGHVRGSLEGPIPHSGTAQGLVGPEALAAALSEGDQRALSGGGIYLVESMAVITGNDIISNSARDFGGGVHLEHSVVTIVGNEVVSNTSGRVFPLWWYDGYGGGIAILPGSEFTLSGNLIADNTVMRGGGGIYITDSVGSLVDSEIRGNGTGDAWEAEAFGGGVYVGYCSPLIQGNRIISNMLGTEEGRVEYLGLGGGIYLLGSSSLVSHNAITGNRVVVGMTSEEAAQGGGIFAAEAYDRGASPVYHAQPGSGEVWPVIEGNRIEGNCVAGSPWLYKGVGGGVSAWGVSITLLDNEILDNCAGRDGAGVLILQHRGPDGGPWVTATVSGNTLTGNALRSEPYSGGGGGLSVLGSVNAAVSDNLISNNEGRLAGGLYVDSATGGVDGNDILDNEAENAGGVLVLSSADLRLTDNRIIGNVSLSNEGGIGVGYGTFLVSHNEIISNTGVHGGGIAVGGITTTATLDANMVIGNRAEQRGGGILVYPDAVFTLTNNIIADNSAEELGGGIYVSDSQGSLINNTIAENNEGEGEGVYLAGTADATILNNVIVSHTYGIYNGGSGTPDVTYNDVWGNSLGDYYGVTPGAGNISSDPRFVDPEARDYHLWLYSPAVDRAHPDADLAPPLDIDGDPRPLGSRVDMGADEVPFEVWVWKSDQPDPVLPGGLVTYTIRLSNVSEESYGGLVMTDRVPVNTSLYWASHEGEESEGVVSWAIGSLGVGEMVTRTMVVQVDEGLTDGTLLHNSEYGANSEDLTRPVMGIPVQTRVGVPMLEISKTGEPDPVRAGSVLTYTLEVKNNGGMRATGLEAWDRVPEDTQFSWASDEGEETGGVVSWTAGELGSGQSLERTMVVTVPEGLADGTLIENVEYGVLCDEVAEPVMGALVSTTVGIPVLVIEKNDEPDPVLPGEALTYTIVVTNEGGWETTGLVITDRTPADTTFYEASDGGKESGGVVMWTVPSLEPGGSLERTLAVTVSEGLPDGSVMENDEYGVKSEDIEVVMGPSASTLVGLPILTIAKEAHPAAAFPGGELEYTLTVSNTGHHVATGVVITDRVPVDASFAWALDGGELVADKVRWSGLTVGPGASLTVRWGAAVTDDLLVGEVVNESYGVLCSEVPEAVMGEAVCTSILRYKLLFPLGMKGAIK